jgi:periplasmic protein TonB
MSAARLDRPDMRIWIAAGLAALALHASFTVRLIQWHEPIPGDEGTEAVLVDLAPLMDEAQSPIKEDLAPGPLQQEAPAILEPPKDEPRQQTEEKIEPLPTVPNAEAVLPKPEQKPIDKPKVEPVTPPAPATTAPPPPRPSAAQMSNWHRKIAVALQRHKGYPAAAQARGETGTATVGFTIDRQGRLVSAHIVRSSQHASLDTETLATVHRALPFPPPPANLPGQTFDFVVPVQFNIR